MIRDAVNDLIDQYKRAFKMFYEELAHFDDDQWIKGVDSFQVPVKMAMHITDTLDYYFSGKSPSEYTWGHRFGGGWWEMKAEQLPDKATIVEYAQEIEERVVAELSALEDTDLSKPFGVDGSAATWLGHYVYAIRHTMHHQGELSTLSVYHGNEGGAWA